MQGMMKAVCTLDPALDLSRGTLEQFREYFETREFELVEPFFSPARKPTIYFLREIPNLLFMRYVQSGVTQEERELRAFCASVRAVDNMVSDDGVLAPAWIPSFDGDGIMRVESLDRFRPYQISEIGGVAYTRSFLARTIKATFLLPPTSLRVLSLREFRPADASPSSPPTGSASPSSGTTEDPAPRPSTIESASSS